MDCWGLIRQEWAFSRAWVSPPTNQVSTTAAVWTTDLEPFRQLIHKAQVLMQDVKICSNRTLWAWARFSTLTMHLSQLCGGVSGGEILGPPGFLHIFKWG